MRIVRCGVSLAGVDSRAEVPSCAFTTSPSESSRCSAGVRDQGGWCVWGGQEGQGGWRTGDAFEIVTESASAGAMRRGVMVRMRRREGTIAALRIRAVAWNGLGVFSLRKQQVKGHGVQLANACTHTRATTRERLFATIVVTITVLHASRFVPA